MNIVEESVICLFVENLLQAVVQANKLYRSHLEMANVNRDAFIHNLMPFFQPQTETSSHSENVPRKSQESFFCFVK